MVTRLSEKQRRQEMGERLPRPTKPVHPSSITIEEGEFESLRKLAEECGLSVASLMRVLIVDAANHPERAGEWKKVADKIRETAPPNQPKPGRPRKSKKPKK